MPAPPEGSEALNVSTIGGEAERSMGMVDATGSALLRPDRREQQDCYNSDSILPGGHAPRRQGSRAMKKYMCLICGWLYDEELGAPEEGLAPGTRWEDVPPNWTCPECGARKEDFEMIEL
jgi:rubredoxin